MFIFFVFAGLYFLQTTSERKVDFVLDPIYEEYNNLSNVLTPSLITTF